MPVTRPSSRAVAGRAGPGGWRLLGGGAEDASLGDRDDPQWVPGPNEQKIPCGSVLVSPSGTQYISQESSSGTQVRYLMGSPPRVNSHNLPLGAAYDAYASLRGRTVHVRDLKEHLPDVMVGTGPTGHTFFCCCMAWGWRTRCRGAPMERSSPRLSDFRLQPAWAEVHDSREAFNNGAPPLRLPSQGQDAQLIPGGSIPSCYYCCWPTIR